MKKNLKEFLVIMIISIIVVFGWRSLELWILGETIPNNVDVIIGTILTGSLYVNYKTLVAIKE